MDLSSVCLFCYNFCVLYKLYLLMNNYRSYYSHVIKFAKIENVSKNRHFLNIVVVNTCLLQVRL